MQWRSSFTLSLVCLTLLPLAISAQDSEFRAAGNCAVARKPSMGCELI